MQKIVVLSGAGISKESGIPTFRDMEGLWNNYNFMELASPQAWNKNPGLVLKFYNFRRKNVIETKPNAAHLLLKKLEKFFDVQIITQNVDDLHERAGSSNVLHLHGEIRKARSTVDESIIINIKDSELNIGDKCPKGSQLRPHIVWFGEPVPNIDKAIDISKSADIFIVIGTSLQVYPAAGLIDYVPQNSKKFIIDPYQYIMKRNDFTYITDTAVSGMKTIFEKLKNN